MQHMYVCTHQVDRGERWPWGEHRYAACRYVPTKQMMARDRLGVQHMQYRRLAKAGEGSLQQAPYRGLAAARGAYNDDPNALKASQVQLQDFLHLNNNSLWTQKCNMLTDRYAQIVT